jgi:class 3 adenylate cyclase
MAGPGAGHHRLIRHELARFRGREIDSAGDGFLAAFDGPAWAVRVAPSMVHAAQPPGIQVGAGVHADAWET